MPTAGVHAGRRHPHANHPTPATSTENKTDAAEKLLAPPLTFIGRPEGKRPALSIRRRPGVRIAHIGDVDAPEVGRHRAGLPQTWRGERSRPPGVVPQLVRTGSEVGVDEGGCSPTRARARCACRSSRIRRAASTPATPAIAAKEGSRRGHHNAGPSRACRYAPVARSRCFPTHTSRPAWVLGRASTGCVWLLGGGNRTVRQAMGSGGRRDSPQ